MRRKSLRRENSVGDFVDTPMLVCHHPEDLDVVFRPPLPLRLEKLSTAAAPMNH